MILRKPYAFLIKNFRVLHLILMAIIGFLAYKTKIIVNFFDEYIVNQDFGIEGVPDLFSKSMFVLPYIFLIVLLAVLIVLIKKQKHYAFYIINIIIAIATLIIYNYEYKNFLELEKILFYSQLGSAFIIFLRALGIGTKKFGFTKDLKELSVSEEDNEEVEVSVELNADDFKRGLKKTKRFIKYYYIEHKLIFFTILFIGIAIISLSTFLIFRDKNKHYLTNDIISSENYTFSVLNTYTTKNNYKQQKITDYYYIIIELKIENHTKTKEILLNEFQLYSNDVKYYPKEITTNNFIDIGKIYKDEEIDKSTIYLLYEVEEVNNVSLRYVKIVDGKWNNIDPIYDEVKLDVIDLDIIKPINEQKLTDEIELSIGDLKGTKVMIENYDIANKIDINYNFCYATNKCFDSVEYLYPKLNTSYKKALFTLKGMLTVSENSIKQYNLYTFLEKFGKIIYSKDGKYYEQTISSQVTTTKVKVQNKIFIEVREELMDVDSIFLQIQVRRS